MNALNSTAFLYHYTSIDSLALILKNHTIRFSPLCKLDDLQEQKSSDVDNLGRFIFVSSWTDDERESIPMWKMYTNPEAGVRIKLRKNPFVWQETAKNAFENVKGLTIIGSKESNNSLYTFLNIAELLKQGCYCSQAWDGNMLHQVEYTDDQTILEPIVLDFSDGYPTINMGKLGHQKNKYWDFQKEWRYVLQFVPFDISGGPEKAAQEFQVTANKMTKGIAALPFSYFDLQIASEFYKEIEITCSPNITESSRIILNALADKYNPSIAIRESELLGKV